MKNSLQNKAIAASIFFLLIMTTLAISGCDIVAPAAKTVDAKANQNTVDANLRVINGAILIYYAEHDTWPADKSDILDMGVMNDWPDGPDRVTYDLVIVSDEVVAAAFKNNSGSWWSAKDDVAIMPVEWQ